MVPSPCLSPIRVYNKTLRTWHYVPCGHCDACVCGKGKRRSTRLSECMARYTHKFFVTLTFNDKYLPLAYFDADTNSFVSDFDADYDGVPYSVDFDTVHQDALVCSDLLMSLQKYNALPVLSRRLLILFKKRLRKKFAKLYGKEYLFIYACGEYGPTTFRPHYHVILCTKAKCTTSEIEMCVRKAWSDYDKVAQQYICQYGDIDFQRILSNGVPNYVASYLNCTTHLPKCYATSQFRPFSQTSPQLSNDLCRYGVTDLQELYYKCSPESDCTSFIDNSCFLDVLPTNIINKVFPKCPKFSLLTHVDRSTLYALYEKQPFERASDFVNAILNSYTSLSSVFGLVKSICIDNDLMASKTRLARLFYLSRRVCLNAKSFGVSLNDYVKQIDLFWSRYELLKLRRFYEMQESLLTDKFNPITVPYLFTLYYNTDDNLRSLFHYFDLFALRDFVHINSIPCQSAYFSLMRKIVMDTTKTKKRNDYFYKQGWKRPMYLPKNNKLCRQFFQT